MPVASPRSLLLLLRRRSGSLPCGGRPLALAALCAAAVCTLCWLHTAHYYYEYGGGDAVVHKWGGFYATHSVEELLRPDDGQSEYPIVRYPLYVRSAYYIASERLLRVIAIRQCDDTSAVFAHMADGDTGVRLKSATINSCPWGYNPRCRHAGFFLDAQLKSAPSAGASVYLTRSSVPIVDTVHARHAPLAIGSIGVGTPASAPYLSVCIQPVYLYADWVQLVQFVELWLATGAQRFYLYVQSVAPEVAPIMQMYVDEGIVEMVSWSYFPVREGSANANYDVFWTGQVTAINDCLHRAAAAQSTFTAFIDQDELVDVYEHPTVASYLRTVAPDTAGVVFASTRVHYTVPPRYYTGRVRPADIDLTYLKGAKREEYIYPTGALSKLIVRPHMVDAMNVHYYRRLWRPAEQRVAPHSAALLLHMRRVVSLTQGERNGTLAVPTLDALAANASSNWRERAARHSKATSMPLRSRGLPAIAEVERCVHELEGRKADVCTNVQASCARGVPSVDASEWLLASNSWMVL